MHIAKGAAPSCPKRLKAKPQPDLRILAKIVSKCHFFISIVCKSRESANNPWIHTHPLLEKHPYSMIATHQEGSQEILFVQNIVNKFWTNIDMNPLLNLSAKDLPSLGEHGKIPWRGKFYFQDGWNQNHKDSQKKTSRWLRERLGNI